MYWYFTDLERLFGAESMYRGQASKGAVELFMMKCSCCYLVVLINEVEVVCFIFI